MSDREGSPSPEGVRERIQAWLLAEGWSISEKSHESAFWLIQVEDRAQRKLLVGQARSPRDQLRIQAAIAVAPDHRSAFQGLPESVRQDLLWELRFRLLSMNVEFTGISEPLEKVTVTHKVYMDGLTKDRFLDRVAIVRNAVIAVVWSIVRRLGTVPPPSSHGDDPVH